MKIVLRRSPLDPVSSWFLSAVAVHWLRERGSVLVSVRPLTVRERYQYDADVPLEGPVDVLDGALHTVTDTREIAFRSHPDLVACVEALGPRAVAIGGAPLLVVEVPDGHRWTLCADGRAAFLEWVSDGTVTWPATAVGASSPPTAHA